MIFASCEEGGIFQVEQTKNYAKIHITFSIKWPIERKCFKLQIVNLFVVFKVQYILDFCALSSGTTYLI